MGYGNMFASNTVTGVESISEDYEAFMQRVYAAVPYGLRAVGSELTKKLQQHIRTDVYGAYTPYSYPRRSNHPQFGNPLESLEYIDLQYSPMSLAFNYEPSGAHSGKQKDRLDWELASKYAYHLGIVANAPLVPVPRNGDDLISLIEKGKDAYEWTRNVPPRPFWSNFVTESVGAGGWADAVFAKGMRSADRDLHVVSDKNVIQDGQDTIFTTNGDSGVPDDVPTGDLPF